MYTPVDKLKEGKRNAVADTVAQRKNKGAKNLVFLDNRPKTVSQLVTYKGKSYPDPTGEHLRDIATFRKDASEDLALLPPRNNVKRDDRMLNILYNSDRNIETKEQLRDIIDPVGKDYQHSIESELEHIRPEVVNIENAINTTRGETFKTEKDEFDRDCANLSKIVVENEMGKVEGSVDKISTIVQWQKIKGISTHVGLINNAARNISDYFNEKGEISKKSKDAFPKKISLIADKADIIIGAANSIEPELKQSGDEQYLRGSVGNKADDEGKSHLIIGKKLDTFKLEGNRDKSSGILKASVWSGGVNDAFIEGGIDDRKDFRLISGVPPLIEEALRSGDYERFVDLAKTWGESEKEKNESEREKPTEGDNSQEPVWWAIWDTRKNALTTLSKELVKLMKAGYVLK